MGAFAPALVALALTARTDGRAGVEALLGQIVRWPRGARWYLFAIGYMATIKLAAALLHRVLTGVWPPFGEEPWYLMAGALVVSTPVQAGEEVGWRGFALPRLASHFGLAPASIVLGVVWACWHLPIFFMPGSGTQGHSFPLYLLSVSAISVAMAWLYWRTNESLLMAMLMHAAVNNTKDIVPSAAVASTTPFTLNASLLGWLTASLLWAAAAYFLVQMRQAALRPVPQARPADSVIPM